MEERNSPRGHPQAEVLRKPQPSSTHPTGQRPKPQEVARGCPLLALLDNDRTDAHVESDSLLDVISDRWPDSAPRMGISSPIDHREWVSPESPSEELGPASPGSEAELEGLRYMLLPCLQAGQQGGEAHDMPGLSI